MIGLGAIAWKWVAVGLGGVLAFVMVLLAPARIWAGLRRLRWWFVGLAALLIVAVFLFVLPNYYRPDDFRPSALPGFFQEAYWKWMLLFLAGAVASAYAASRVLATRRPASGAPDVATFPDLDAAWDEIQVRMGQANIDLGSRRVILILTPDEERAAALVESAGLQVFARAPAVDAPIHAYATADAVLLSCAGACAFGEGDERAGERLADLAGKLLVLQPDCPVVRGIVVLLPIDWAGRAEAVRQAAAVRADLQVVQRVLKVRCPVFALLPGMEVVPGFPEFVGRIAAQVSPQMLDQRVGFAVPGSVEFGGDLVQRGLTWQSGWFHSWILNLLAGDPMNHRGNAELVALDEEIRRYRRHLRAIMESAFSTPKEADPIRFRGCYFAATGDGRGEYAFSAGLFRGPRSRVLADHVATTWTEEALREDRRYSRIALAVGLVGGLAILLAWVRIAQWTGGLGWLGLLIIAIAWFLILLRYWRT